MSEQLSPLDLESLFKSDDHYSEVTEENKEALRKEAVLVIVANREEILQITGRDFGLNPAVFVAEISNLGSEYKDLSLYLQQLFSDAVGFTRTNIGNTITDAEFKKLQYKYDLHQAISQINMDFDQISKEEFASIVDKALELLREAITADRVYIFEFFDQQEKLKNTYEWVNSDKNIEPFIDRLNQLRINEYPYLKEKVLNEKIIMSSICGQS